MATGDAEIKKAALQAAAQIEVAKINAMAQQGQAMVTEHDAMQNEGTMSQILETQQQLLAMIAAPKMLIKDEAGRTVGIQTVTSE